MVFSRGEEGGLILGCSHYQGGLSSESVTVSCLVNGLNSGGVLFPGWSFPGGGGSYAGMILFSGWSLHAFARVVLFQDFRGGVPLILEWSFFQRGVFMLLLGWSYSGVVVF